MICGHKMSQFYLVWVEVVVRGSQRSLPEKVIIELRFKEMVGVNYTARLEVGMGMEWGPFQAECRKKSDILCQRKKGAVKELTRTPGEKGVK